MKIYFDWINSFYDNPEWRNDEEIFALNIIQREGSFAIARASIKAQKSKKIHIINVQID